MGLENGLAIFDGQAPPDGMGGHRAGGYGWIRRSSERHQLKPGRQGGLCLELVSFFGVAHVYSLDQTNAGDVFRCVVAVCG